MTTDITSDEFLQEQNKRIEQLAKGMSTTIALKNSKYRNSWAKRGGVGAAMMMLRKTDRLEEGLKDSRINYDIFKLLPLSTGDETYENDVVDLICYLMLILDMYRFTNPIKPFPDRTIGS